MISTGRIGVASRLSMVPRSRSRVIASAVNITIVIVQHHAEQAGHDVVLGDAFRVVAALDVELERRRALGCSMQAGRATRARARVDRRLRSAAIALPVATGSVASAATSKRRTLAARSVAPKLGRDLDRELHRRRERAARRPPRRSARPAAIAK